MGHGCSATAYRFFDNDAIEAQDMWHSHGESTYRCLAPVSLVLAVPETTEVHGTGHPAPQGLGHLRQDKHGFPLIIYHYAAIGSPSCGLASQR